MKTILYFLVLQICCLGLHAQESHPLKDAFIAQSEEMKKLSAEKIPIAEKVDRFKLRVDTLLQIVTTEGFADLIEMDGGEVKEILAGVYRLAENYELAKKYIRELLDGELEEDKRRKIIAEFIDILKEEHRFKPPLSTAFLYDEYYIDIIGWGNNSPQDPDIGFLPLVEEYELALELIAPEGREIGFDIEREWPQYEFIKVIEYRDSQEVIKEALATAKIKLNLGESTEAELSGKVTVFGYTFKLYIPAGIRELLIEQDDEERKKTLREVFEATSFYRIFAHDWGSDDSAGFGLAPVEERVNWPYQNLDLETIKELSKVSNKPIILFFTGHAVINGVKMEDQVLNDMAIEKRLKEDFVFVSLYVDDRQSSGDDYKTIGARNKALFDKFAGQGLPFFVAMDAAEQVMGTIGYVKKGEFLRFLEEVGGK